jgi:predicted DNA-binding transcriptional regulator AlpA
MSTNSVQGASATAVGARQPVSISRWVNEPYPAWDLILTAHDVARLIRRSPWMLSGMVAIGQFPKKQRFRGKNIGWLKADILDWMARTHRNRVVSAAKPHPRRRCESPNQQTLPLQCASARALLGPNPKPVSTIAGVSL